MITSKVRRQKTDVEGGEKILPSSILATDTKYLLFVAAGNFYDISKIRPTQ